MAKETTSHSAYGYKAVNQDVTTNGVEKFVEENVKQGKISLFLNKYILERGYLNVTANNYN